jgi:hypothetical protein
MCCCTDAKLVNLHISKQKVGSQNHVIGGSKACRLAHMSYRAMILPCAFFYDVSLAYVASSMSAQSFPGEMAIDGTVVVM